MRTLVQRVCLGDARDVSYVTNAERLSSPTGANSDPHHHRPRVLHCVCHPPFVLNRFADTVIQRQHFVVDASAPSVVYTPVLTICR